MTTPTNMPPLPDPISPWYSNGESYLNIYSVKHMHAYAKAYAAQCTAPLEKRVAELEGAVKVMLRITDDYVAALTPKEHQ